MLNIFTFQLQTLKQTLPLMYKAKASIPKAVSLLCFCREDPTVTTSEVTVAPENEFLRGFLLSDSSIETGMAFINL